MIYTEDFEKVINEKLNCYKLNSSRTEILTFCPWCEEHKMKEPATNNPHLYIATEQPVFNCFRCNVKGSVLKLLLHIGIVDYKPYINQAFNFSVSRPFRVDLSKQFQPKEYVIPRIENDNLFKEKQVYVADRLGVSLEQLAKVPNLVFDVKAFVEQNNIKTTVNSNFLDFLQNKFFGFVTTRGTTLVLRAIESNCSIRYYKMALGVKSYFNDFYGVRSNKTKEDKTNTIVLCEGIFDLLCAYRCEKLKGLKDESMYWAAVLSKNYKHVACSVIDYCKITKANVVVLSDSDATEDEIKKQLKWLPVVQNLKICWNTLGKDFGVSEINPVIKYV